jgi:hypothetical protein
MMPAQIVATGPAVGPDEAKDLPVEVLEPNGETPISERSTRSDGRLTEAVEPSTMPVQIVAPEPAAEELSQTDHVTVVGLVRDVPVEPSPPSGETQNVEIQP